MNAFEKFRPQWLYVKPAGSNEEPFDVPFSFALLANGTAYKDLPIQMDNEECIIRGIFFNPIPEQGAEPPLTGPFFLMRLRDTYGNPTSDEPTLNCGGWANPVQAGCGFPVESELRCSSGGVVLADITMDNLDNGSDPIPTVTISGALRCVRRRKC